MSLAQVNIARFILPADDPANQDFANNIDRVNSLAEAAPGFIWRFSDADRESDEEPSPATTITVLIYLFGRIVSR
ncbi:DUF3291 domain-containing protein [Halioxenophilus aromaticivorans]|uniref:DUF3291 domain-containing protein n=1 Tax=Halioxenophilus aromaticivorans TaxID=1306992 RepID=A0AAV3U1L3_9ALTE